MSGIRRPASSIDARRLGEGVSFPGIDPRSWISLAVVTAFYMDPEHGPLVDVDLLPSGMPGTARVGGESARGDAGDWRPIAVDDEVLVGIPDGEPAHGMVVLRRLWAPSDAPAQEMIDHPDDVLIKARPGQTIRIITSGGGGDILFKTDAGESATVSMQAGAKVTLIAPDVRLGGDDDLVERVIKGDTYRQAEDLVLTAIGAFLNSIAPGPITPAQVALAAAAKAAIDAFQMVGGSFLSGVVKTK